MRKKTWKKAMICSLAALMIVSVSGCSSKSGSKNTKETKKEEQAKETKKKVPDTEAQTSAVLSLSEVQTLNANDKDKKFKEYVSSDTNIVTVTEDGIVHAIKAGTAAVTYTDGSNQYTCNIKVKKRGMVYPVFTMMKGEHLDIQFSNKDSGLSWTSTDSSIASVNAKGKVTAKKVGTAVITGTNRENVVYQCNLTVNKKIKNIIYLTFDDGPNRYTTPKVLKILKQNNVKATFFELKPAKKDFDLTKRVLDEGHTLAMHGYQHKYDIIYRSEKTYHQNLDKLRNLFFEKFGVWCTLTRFPGGSSNTCSSYNPGIMTRLTKKLDGWGYHYFDWNVSSGDASRGTTPAQEMHNLKKETTKGHDSVVLMHDFYNNQPTLKSLDKYIKYAKKKGYTFMPLTASTAEVHHGVNN